MMNVVLKYYNEVVYNTCIWLVQTLLSLVLGMTFAKICSLLYSCLSNRRDKNDRGKSGTSRLIASFDLADYIGALTQDVMLIFDEFFGVGDKIVRKISRRSRHIPRTILFAAFFLFAVNKIATVLITARISQNFNKEPVFVYDQGSKTGLSIQWTPAYVMSAELSLVYCTGLDANSTNYYVGVTEDSYDVEALVCVDDLGVLRLRKYKFYIRSRPGSMAMVSLNLDLTQLYNSTLRQTPYNATYATHVDTGLTVDDGLIGTTGMDAATLATDFLIGLKQWVPDCYYYGYPSVNKMLGFILGIIVLCLLFILISKNAAFGTWLSKKSSSPLSKVYYNMWVPSLLYASPTDTALHWTNRISGWKLVVGESGALSLELDTVDNNEKSMLSDMYYY